VKKKNGRRSSSQSSRKEDTKKNPKNRIKQRNRLSLDSFPDYFQEQIMANRRPPNKSHVDSCFTEDAVLNLLKSVSEDFEDPDESGPKALITDLKDILVKYLNFKYFEFFRQKNRLSTEAKKLSQLINKLLDATSLYSLPLSFMMKDDPDFQQLLEDHFYHNLFYTIATSPDGTLAKLLKDTPISNESIKKKAEESGFSVDEIEEQIDYARTTEKLEITVLQSHLRV